MKKNFFILIFAAMAITACQQASKTVPVNLEAEKAAIDSLFDKFNSAFSAPDVTTLASFLSEDALCMGTDPSEFWNKQQMTEMWTQLLTDSVPELNYIGERVVKLASDGHSAFAVDQYFMPMFSEKIPWRNTYQLTKTDGQWKILVLNCALIPKNEDMPKLNASME